MEAYVIDGVYTPRASVRKGKSAYSSIRPQELVASCFRSLRERQPSFSEVTSAYIGCVSQVNDQGANCISRSELEQFALASHRKASKARKAGYFQSAFCYVRDADSKPLLSEEDHIRDDASLATMELLPPAFARCDPQYGGHQRHMLWSPLVTKSSVEILAI